MPKVLIVGSAELGTDLERTILWADGVERALVSTPGGALDVARAFVPSIVVVEGTDAPAAIGLLVRLRENAGTRRSSIVVVSRQAGLPEEELVRAGANLVLTGPVDPPLWNARLGELFVVPRRVRTRLLVRAIPPGPPLRRVGGVGGPRGGLQGPRLPVFRPPGPTRRRRQAPEARAGLGARGRGVPLALSQGGAGGGPPRSLQYRDHLRRGRGLLRHGAPRRGHPAGDPAEAREARPGRGPADPGSRGRGHGLRPLQGDDPPRHQARQPLRSRRWNSEGDGLWGGPPDVGGHHRQGAGLRLPRLHAAGADHERRGLGGHG